MADLGSKTGSGPERGPVDVVISRRSVLRGGAGTAGAGLLVFATGAGTVAVAPGAGFLTPGELKLLAAVVDRVVPGQPEDLAVGAVQVGCAGAIDALLAAFSTDPPRIFAGAPFSDRGGSPVNHFTDFLPLDAYEDQAWRLRIEGFQQTYRRGLAALARSQPLFAALPGPLRDLALRVSTNADVVALRDLVVTHTLEFYFAAPEYGGNKGGAAWKAVGFEGDRQPRGYTYDEIQNPAYAPLPLLSPDLGGLLGSLVGSLLGGLTATVSGLVSAVLPGGPALPASVAAAGPALPLSASDAAQGMMAGGTDHGSVRRSVDSLLEPLTDPDSRATRDLESLHQRAADLVARVRAGEDIW